MKLVDIYLTETENGWIASVEYRSQTFGLAQGLLGAQPGPISHATLGVECPPLMTPRKAVFRTPEEALEWTREVLRETL